MTTTIRHSTTSARLRRARRGVAVALALAASILALPVGASAGPHDSGRSPVTRVTYRSTGAEGHPALDSGGVLDVTLGRRSGAIELHRVVGAAPSTTYAVGAEIYLASACAADDPFGPVPVDEGTLATNAAGSGSTVVRFPGDAFVGAPDLFWVRWLLRVDGTVAYASDCARIELGH